jgi:glyoxylase-like metal-dependent hydrolase (beta-lactamase superfamily II)
MKFGDFEIQSFVEQNFRLDGGQMFGVIPKTLWQRMIPADENNLIPMAANIFVLRAHGKKMIFDAGLGDTLNKRECKIYATEGISNIELGLASLELTPDDIDYVILTHLHTDHAGGAVKLEGNKLVPRFPKATHIFAKQDYDAAIEPNERTAAVYHPDRYYAIMDSGRTEVIDSDTELFPGIWAIFTGGHTEGHFALHIESGDKKVFYYADIFPTSHHMKVPYVPATDISPLQSMDVKRSILPEIINDGVVLCFDHDVDRPFGRVRLEEEKIVVDTVDADAGVVVPNPKQV